VKKRSEGKAEDSSTPIVGFLFSFSVCLKTLTKGHLESFTASRTNKKHKKHALKDAMARNNNQKINVLREWKGEEGIKYSNNILLICALLIAVFVVYLFLFFLFFFFFCFGEMMTEGK
jgi:hypothetical protein